MSRRKRSFVAQPDSRRSWLGTVRGAGELEAEIGHRPDQRVTLEQRAVRSTACFRCSGRYDGAEPAPRDEVGARRDRRRRVDLEQRQPLDDREQVGRPRRVEQLRAHRDAPRLLLREPVHRGEG